MTVPVEPVPPTTVVGLTVMDETRNGITVSAAETLPFQTALMFAEADEETALLVTVNVPEVEFAAMATVAGTVAAAVLSLARFTMMPPDGAAAFRRTVPVEFALPPTTEVGERVNDCIWAGLTVNVADAVPPYAAEIVTGVDADTGLDVTVKVAVLAFAFTVTVEGTVAAALLPLDKETVNAEGAGPVSVTVAVEFAIPPTTDVGDKASD